MRLLLNAALSVCVLGALTAHATVEVDDATRSGNPGFYRQLDCALATLEKSGDPHIRRLLAALRAAPGRITIRPMTGDPSTWSVPVIITDATDLDRRYAGGVSSEHSEKCPTVLG
jgi:hypothetical protein